MTSGAFYRYFASKEQAFEEAVVQGLIEYRDRVVGIQSRHGKRWLRVFVTDYLREGHRADLAGGCIVPGLTADVVRAGKVTRAKYQAHLEEVVRVIANGLPRKSIRTARALMATLSGAVEMSRAVDDRTAVLAIRRAAYQAVTSIVRYRTP
jgi:TetR/AcrR family transcriptional repressor of nem operon